MRFLKRLLGGNQGLSSSPSRAANLDGREQVLGPSDFGPFKALFSAGPGYLSFLGMRSPDVQRALIRLSEILKSSDDAHTYIPLLLQGRNWRPHLVGSVAVLLSHEPTDYLPRLWRTFDYGSWVAPQLGVVLYFSDPKFGREANHRIASRCPVTAAPDLSPEFEHIIRSKNIASLLRVVRLIPSETDWAASALKKADIRAFIEADRDSSGEIADRWLEAVQTQFAQFGCDLRPRQT